MYNVGLWEEENTHGLNFKIYCLVSTDLKRCKIDKISWWVVGERFLAAPFLINFRKYQLEEISLAVNLRQLFRKYHAEKRRRYFPWRKSGVDSIIYLAVVLGSYIRQVFNMKDEFSPK